LAAPGFEVRARGLLSEAVANLARIESQIKELIALRDRERGRIGALKYALSPVRMLPSDILTEIFLEAVCTSSAPIKADFEISAVCAYWRHLVLNTPRLWTNVDIKVARASAEYSAMVADILQRSEPHPVAISLTKPGSAPPRSPFFIPILDAVLSVAGRWETIFFNFDIIPLLKDFQPPTLSHLTSMTLHLLYDYDDVQPGSASSLCLDAPKLKVVDLTMPDFARLPMPWSQLTHLKLTNDTPDSEFLDIISQCVSLVQLTLDVCAWKDNIPTPVDVVSLPHLLDLRVDVSHPLRDNTFEPFFARFAFPALQKLDVRREGRFDTDLGYEFPRFLGRCPNLESLSISYSNMGAYLLAGILLNSPSLTKLELLACRKCITDAFFELLTYREADSTAPVAPDLKTLHLENVGQGYTEGPMLFPCLPALHVGCAS
ncbi:hypothetical protein C8F01DRAFT_1137095, partial [Mycena amicta]